MKRNNLLKLLLVSTVFGLGGCNLPVISNSSTTNSNSSINSTSSSVSKDPIKKIHTVTWVVGDKTYDEKYYEGETPTYKFGTSKESDETYTYTFSGWDKLITPVTENVTYTALYHQEYINYTYTWIVDGKETTETYHYGDEATYKGETPYKEGDDQYEYTFTGWSKDVSTVTGDETVEAQFERSVRQYTVTFDVEGVKTTGTYYYGELPEYDGTPTKESDEDYTYTFVGWNNAITPVTGDVTYKAVFDAKLIEFYDVKFFDYAGNLLYETNLKGGNIPTYQGNTPTIIDSKNNSYDFVGWLDRSTNTPYTGELPAVTKDTNYYAYSKELGVLVVNYYENGNLTSTISQEVMNNDSYTYTANSKTGYVPNFDYVKGSMNLSATYDIHYSKVDTWDKSSVSSSLSGEGTEENPYLIQSGADLAYFKNQIANGNTYKYKYVKMTKSIDLNGSNFMLGSFAGHFDGDIYTIRGLAINNTSSNTGLFSKLLAGGTLNNITLYGDILGKGICGSIVGESNGTVSGCTNYAQVKGNGQRGGIVGYAYAPIVNCVNYGKVTSNESGWNVGGIVGQTIDSIINCVNNGDVDGATSVGGMFGETTDGIVISISNCTNNGSVTGTWGVGGMSGNGYNTLFNNDRNYGKISGTGQVGGITGKGKGTIDTCFNYGDITSQSATGGIAGEVTGGSILKSENHGSITGYASGSNKGDRTGGIAGQFNGVEVSQCKNYGIITGTNTLGGLIGKTWNSNRAKFDELVNYGTIYGSSYLVGGIFGTADVCDISNCENHGEIISTSDCIGGIAGAIYANGTMDNCHNYGNITGTNNLGGILYNNQGIVSNCTNSGTLTLTKSSGNAAGTIFTDKGTTTNCSSTGQIIKP